jgi:hypothetical protein
MGRIWPFRELALAELERERGPSMTDLSYSMQNILRYLTLEECPISYDRSDDF